jgi:four helix bundle protein
MSDFRKLLVWQKSHELSVDLKPVVQRLRGPEGRSLRSQIARAASSIPTNLVEGRAMPGSKEFARFVGYAIASSSELEYHLISVRDKALIPAREATHLLTRVVEIRRMLYGLLRRLRSNNDGALD